jgi:hypothetical protein
MAWYNLVLILFDQNKTKIFYNQFCSPKQNKITKILPKLAKQNKTKIKTQMLTIFTKIVQRFSEQRPLFPGPEGGCYTQA